jgi:hypothetical protein
MTDDWERPLRPKQPTIEIPLSGDGPLAVFGDEPNTAPPPNWRKIVGLTSLLGVVLGILLAIVLINFVWDEEPEGGIAGNPTTTVDGFDLAAEITTPATLVDPNPVPTTIAPPTRPVRTPGAPVREGPLRDQILVPTYSAVDRDFEPSPGSYDLYTAVSELGVDVPRRSSTRLELGVGGFVSEHTILRDPVAGRYLVSRRDVTMIVDEASGLTYVDWPSPEGEQWLPLDDRPLAESVGISSVGELHRRMMLGPIRPDTISGAMVTTGDFVLLEDQISVARMFTVTVPASLIPEWQLYVFGPTNEFVSSDLPSRLTYTVYVDEDNQIRRIVGLSDLGRIPQLVIHDLDQLAERYVVDLPDPATVATGPPR